MLSMVLRHQIGKVNDMLSCIKYIMSGHFAPCITSQQISLLHTCTIVLLYVIPVTTSVRLKIANLSGGVKTITNTAN